MSSSYDYLIIGQGIAGTTLAIRLLDKGKSVLIVDENAPGSASRVAAGFIHPVTGRRIVKTWLADIFIPSAHQFYSYLEIRSGKKFLHNMVSLEMVTDVKTANDWNSRCSEIPDYVKRVSPNENRPALQAHTALYNVSKGGWLDLPNLLDHFRNKWISDGILKNEKLNLEDMIFDEEEVQWKSMRFKKAVWCQGAAGRNDGLWKQLPFDPAKGELLTVHIPGLPAEEIIVHGIFFIPLGNDHFKVGSTYSWHEFTAETTEGARIKLEEKIRKTIRLPFETVGQQAGIRPSVKGRRPLLGKHPDSPHCYIFNGLGSKGGSMAPWLSERMVEFLETGNRLPEESDISRFL